MESARSILGWMQLALLGVVKLRVIVGDGKSPRILA
jgi:hypothetical protein